MQCSVYIERCRARSAASNNEFAEATRDCADACGRRRKDASPCICEYMHI